MFFDWSNVIENILANGSIAILAYLFGQRILNHIKLSKKMEKYGFEEVYMKRQTKKDLRDMYRDASLVKIMYVSGKTYLKMNEDILKEAMDSGTKIKFLCVHPNSFFAKDIENLEINNNIRDENSIKINEEIRQIIDNYRDYISKGSFSIKFFSSEYRLPVTLAYGEENSSGYVPVKGWLTVTLPPYQSKDNFILEVSRESVYSTLYKNLDNYDYRYYAGTTEENFFDDAGSFNFVTMMETHFDSIWNEYAVGFEEEMQRIYFNEQLKVEWKDKYNQAKEKSERHKESGSGVLIEIAAQHPLTKEGLPGEEFKKRLDYGYELYKFYLEKNENIKLYIPGSIHKDNGVADKLSLSSSGKKYLIGKGVKEDDIFSDESNYRYKGEEGVYNSYDECYVATNLFIENEFSKLVCICSPSQSFRKIFNYISLGVVPDIEAVNVDKLHHNYIVEYFTKIPEFIFSKENYEKQRSDRRP